MTPQRLKDEGGTIWIHNANLEVNTGNLVIEFEALHGKVSMYNYLVCIDSSPDDD